MLNDKNNEWNDDECISRTVPPKVNLTSVILVSLFEKIKFHDDFERTWSCARTLLKIILIAATIDFI